MHAQLTSKLSTKVFMLFVIASFLPLLIGAGISYYQVQSIIREDVTNNLQDTAKEYGIGLFSRVKLAKDTLDNNARNLTVTGQISLAQNHLADYFSAVSIRSADDTITSVWGEVDPRIYNVRSLTNTKIVTLTKTADRKDIYIILPSGVYGKIDSEFLWDIENTDQEIKLCVTNHVSEKLFCDVPLTSNYISDALGEAKLQGVRLFQWQQNHNTILSSYWSLFLDHEFNIDDWMIIASQDQTIGQNRIADYRNFFLPLLMFSLLLVVLLSLITIRKNLDIVNKLIDGTRRIIHSDFHARVNIQGNDEFAELADSFNSMAQSLEGVANEYTAFSAVDKSILASEDSTNVIEAIFASLYVIYPFKSLYLLNHSEARNSLKRYYFQAGKEAPVKANNHKLLSTFEFSFIRPNTIKTLPVADIALKKLQQHWPFNAANICVIPILQNNQCHSLILGTLEASEIDSFSADKLNSFSNRVAVAFQALTREATLHYQANFDALTSIPNRTQMITMCDQRKRDKLPQHNWSAFLFLDLDRFKMVNDNYGHITGDQLLQQLAARLETQLTDDEILARLGGDEFAIVTHGREQEQLLQRVDQLCKGIIETAGEPFSISHHVLHVGTSIGVFVNPQHQENFEESLRYADIAMYFSKQQGGNCYTVYSEGMSETLLKKTLLERDLRVALGEQTIDIHYQPKVCAHSHQVVGFEALFRWTHPTYGSIPPPDAIQMAEDIGVINELGQQVFERSLQQWQHWLEAGLKPGIIAVNISPMQLRRMEFVEFVRKTLERYPLVSPDSIELEITESLMLEDKRVALKVLEQLRALGLSVAIDDFGTGYSSLSYLLDIPANILKIDRSFVIKIEQDDNASALLSSLIDLGKSMGYTIVAEGIETAQQADFLANCKTDQLQGYLFGKPLPATLVENRFLKQQQPLSGHKKAGRRRL